MGALGLTLILIGMIILIKTCQNDITISFNIEEEITRVQGEINKITLILVNDARSPKEMEILNEQLNNLKDKRDQLYILKRKHYQN